MRYGKKPLSDLDNRVIINCGGVRHESYKVETYKNMLNFSFDEI